MNPSLKKEWFAYTETLIIALMRQELSSYLRIMQRLWEVQEFGQELIGGAEIPTQTYLFHGVVIFIPGL